MTDRSDPISLAQLQSYLWGAATILRGLIDAGDYKQFIFPLVFYKRFMTRMLKPQPGERIYFFNSPMEACVVVCRARKPPERQGRILFIDAINAITRERAYSFLKPVHQQRIAADLFAELNAIDESVQIEAKKASESGKSVQQTVCAFANEPGLGGGYLLLGAAWERNDKGDVLARRSGRSRQTPARSRQSMRHHVQRGATPRDTGRDRGWQTRARGLRA